MRQKEIVVIGGGAAGLTASIFAAKAGARVKVLEKEKKAGMKLLRTGSGRCNLSNVSVTPGKYEERGRDFAAAVTEAFSLEQTLAFFRGIGVFTREIDGYIYPFNEEAASVLTALRTCAETLGVSIRQNEPVLDILSSDGFLKVRSGGWEYRADAVICAAGSPAGIKDGTAGILPVLERLGHHIYPFFPALSSLQVLPSVKPLAGVRARGKVTLLTDGSPSASESGQIQFTERGISGICVMNLSARALSALREGRRTELSIDFMPDGAPDSKEIQKGAVSLLPSKIRSFLLKSGIKEADVINDFRFEVTGSPGLAASQAAYGGVDTREVSSGTLQSLIVPGLYLAGEILDVTGLCGGMNLQFAWSSGALAGMHAGDDACIGFPYSVE
ncbi:MAG: aminoacetone oxidase family FAD-binding enzyme [Lachnospiraceae bacterium]|nr:aminoacetone oxidase family FAD-binding enzyme [Lachnospiraceae bacterium]